MHMDSTVNPASNADHIDRVSDRIGSLIVSFCRSRLDLAPEFHMVELTSWIARHHAIAPDSPGRILRHLRKQGALDYRVLSRRDSLYQLTHVRRAA